MSRRWLVLRLEGPLMSFGGVAVDHVGPVRDFPAASMLTGLIGNAFGWHWSDRTAHQAVQDRLVFAARHDRDGRRLTDIQNARLAKTDRGWTTHVAPERRGGGDRTYHAPHRRQREYHADLSVRIVLRLEPADEPPTLDAVAAALDRPARPLFLGRKSCLPSAPLLAGKPSARWVAGHTACEALRAVPGAREPLRSWWPMGEGPDEAGGDAERVVVDRIVDVADLRNWRTGLHAGARQVVEGRVTPVNAP